MNKKCGKALNHNKILKVNNSTQYIRSYNLSYLIYRTKFDTKIVFIPYVYCINHKTNNDIDTPYIIEYRFKNQKHMYR